MHSPPNRATRGRHPVGRPASERRRPVDLPPETGLGRWPVLKAGPGGSESLRAGYRSGDGCQAQRARPSGCRSRCPTPQSRRSGASLAICPAALDLPRALVEWADAILAHDVRFPSATTSRCAPQAAAKGNSAVLRRRAEHSTSLTHEPCGSGRGRHPRWRTRAAAALGVGQERAPGSMPGVPGAESPPCACHDVCAYHP
jgi:hypothetical protein